MIFVSTRSTWEPVRVPSVQILGAGCVCGGCGGGRGAGGGYVRERPKPASCSRCQEVKYCMSLSGTLASPLNLSLTEWIWTDSSSLSSSPPFLQLVNYWDESTSQISLMYFCLQTRENDTFRGDMGVIKRSLDFLRLLPRQEVLGCLIQILPAAWSSLPLIEFGSYLSKEKRKKFIGM